MTWITHECERLWWVQCEAGRVVKSEDDQIPRGAAHNSHPWDHESLRTIINPQRRDAACCVSTRWTREELMDHNSLSLCHPRPSRSDGAPHAAALFLPRHFCRHVRGSCFCVVKYGLIRAGHFHFVIHGFLHAFTSSKGKFECEDRTFYMRI